METFRKDWFPERSWEIVQSNRSDSKAGVLRGLHYHFHQVDYWHVPHGQIRVGLADLRPSSPTYGASQVLEIGDHNQVGVFIPVGVAHGFLTLTDATVTYLVDQYYNGSDEFGVAWNDPALAAHGASSSRSSPGANQQNLCCATLIQPNYHADRLEANRYKRRHAAFVGHVCYVTNKL